MLEIFFTLHIVLATCITVILATQFYREKNIIHENALSLKKKDRDTLIQTQVTDAKASFLLNSFLSWMFPFFVVLGYICYKAYYFMRK